MATAILDLEYEQMPAGIEGLDEYREALILLRLRGQPVGRAWAPVQEGRIAPEALRATLAGMLSWAFWERWLSVSLGYDANRPALQTGNLSATVATCTRERPDDLRRCLAAVLQMPDDGQEILVVDNNPKTDATRQVVASFPRVRYVREDQPGLDAARNRALKEARGEIIAFVDDDAAPDANWLRALLRNFADPLVLCVTGLTMPVELQTEAQEWFERYSAFSRGFYRRMFDWSNINPMEAGRAGAGANMALRRSVLELIGPFDPALDAGTPTQSGGDTEMYARLLSAGYRIVYDPAALNWHRHRRTWDELLRAIYGYGVGTYAFWTRKLFLERRLGVIKLAANWFWRYQLPALLRAVLKRPGSLPADLLWAELRGCAAGPWAYWQARRAVQRWEAKR